MSTSILGTFNRLVNHDASVYMTAFPCEISFRSGAIWRKGSTIRTLKLTWENRGAPKDWLTGSRSSSLGDVAGFNSPFLFLGKISRRWWNGKPWFQGLTDWPLTRKRWATRNLTHYGIHGTEIGIFTYMNGWIFYGFSCREIYYTYMDPMG